MPLVLTVDEDEEVWINGELKMMFKRHKGIIRITFEGPPEKYDIKRKSGLKPALERLKGEEWEEQS